MSERQTIPQPPTRCDACGHQAESESAGEWPSQEQADAMLAADADPPEAEAAA